MTLSTATEAVPHHAVKLRHRIGSLQIDVECELSQPWTILFGPSGSGKTTILRAVAGHLKPDSAHIVRTRPSPAEKTLVDTMAGIFVPPHERSTPLASQQPALFPHLSILDNITYGSAQSKLATATLLDDFRLTPLAHKLPHQISGGEAQRVNLARAIARPNSRLLLLDEPFSGLDHTLRDHLMATLVAWQARTATPILSVTHDVGEALQLNAQVIQLCNGRIVQHGPAAAVLADERARLLRLLTPKD